MEVGISISDLDFLTIGLVLDIWTEKGNDSVEYATLATQEDFVHGGWSDSIFHFLLRLNLEKGGKGVWLQESPV